MAGEWCDYESIRRPRRNAVADSGAERPRFGSRGSSRASAKDVSSRLPVVGRLRTGSSCCGRVCSCVESSYYCVAAARVK
jgi:hypothetical protein